MGEIKVIIKSAGDKKHEVTVDTTKTISEFKVQLATEMDIPAERQRLIYSGKVLKDADTLELYKIQDGHTIHLVKGAAPKNSTPTAPTTTESTPAAASSTASPAQANVPSNIAAGQGQFNPLAGLTGARYAGYNVPMPSMESMGFGSDGMQLPDENQMERMMESPMFQESMRAMLSDPQMLDFMIQQSPQLRSMGPAAREMLQSEYFRNMLTNPEMMRSMMQMQRAMGGGEGAGASFFPAPGNATNTNSTNTDNTNNTASDRSASTSTDAAAAAASNPFAALLGGAGAGGATGGASGANPFLNPNLLNFLGGAGAAPQHTQDNRPPEELFESQLRQLNDMGFFDFDRNVTALRRSGGSVEGAIEALLNGSV